jgi:hypothetical protein
MDDGATGIAGITEHFPLPMCAHHHRGGRTNNSVDFRVDERRALTLMPLRYETSLSVAIVLPKSCCSCARDDEPALEPRFTTSIGVVVVTSIA